MAETAEPAAPALAVGARVRCLYPTDGGRYPATVTGAGQGVYTVRWDDGDTEHLERPAAEVWPLTESDDEGTELEEPGAPAAAAPAPAAPSAARADEAGPGRGGGKGGGRMWPLPGKAIRLGSAVRKGRSGGGGGRRRRRQRVLVVEEDE